MRQASDLRVERLRVGVSGGEVAKALRISKSLLYYWETGQRKIPPEKREKIRKYLLTRSTLAV
jgi:DNA-binding transcriptional regulator YiaG